MGQIVSVEPLGREEFGLQLNAPPRYSSAIFGGYELAEIEVEWDEDDRTNLLGAKLRVHGQSGVVWQGIVTRRPGKGEPLVARGWGLCATFGRREAMYCDTALANWQLRYAAVAEQEGWNLHMTAVSLRIFCPKGIDREGYHGWWKQIPTTSASRITFDWERYSTDIKLGLFYGTTTDGTEPSWTLVEDWAAWGSGALSGSGESIDIAASHNCVMWRAYSQASGDATGLIQIAKITDIKLYGVEGVTSTTTKNVVADILTNEIDTDYLPSGSAYLDWIDDEATVVEPLVFDSSEAVEKLREMTKYAANDFGWYSEDKVGCLPHWTARSTTPDYIVKLEEAEAYDLDESSLDELVSAVRVHYSTQIGRSTFHDVIDTDTTHPLVELGVTRYGDIYAQTTSTATASAIGDVYLDDHGRPQVKGAISTRYVYTTTGAPAYLPDIRPGQMIRITGLPDGEYDAIVKRITLTGDEYATIECDNEPYRLDVALARLAKRESPR